MADTNNERVDGGALPDWDVAELPEPPKYQFGKAFRSHLRSRYYCVRGFNRER